MLGDLGVEPRAKCGLSGVCVWEWRKRLHAPLEQSGKLGITGTEVVPEELNVVLRSPSGVRRKGGQSDDGRGR